MSPAAWSKYQKPRLRRAIARDRNIATTITTLPTGRHVVVVTEGFETEEEPPGRMLARLGPRRIILVLGNG